MFSTSYAIDVNGFVAHSSFIPASLAIFFIGYVSVRLLLKLSTPLPTKINVCLPEQAQPSWTGEVLSDPTIYAKDPSVIQCYCPATGQLIDTVKAATVEDVNTAIEKAKTAQQKWAKTTFRQRALVLKTLLRFILENQGISHLLLAADRGSEEIARVACRDSGVSSACSS